MRKSAAVSMGLAVTAIVAALPGSALAVTPAADDALPNVDRRAAERAPVAPATRAARGTLAKELGPLGDVRGDAKSGGVAYVGRPDALLTSPSDDFPREIVLDYVREHGEVFGLHKGDFANLRLVARSVSPDGITHLRFNQELDGILAFDSGIEGHVTRDGRLINVSGAPVPGAELPATTPDLGAAAGLRAARAAVDGATTSLPRQTDVEPGPARTTTFAGGERAVLRWSATADGPRLAWSVVAEDGEGHSYDVLVDADSGELLRRQSLTEQLGQARYFSVDPRITPVQTQITMPPAWYDDNAGGTRLWGQYARTYADPSDEDPAPGAEVGGTRVQIPASAGGAAAPDWLYGPPTTFPAATPCPATGCTWDSATPTSATVNQFQVGTNVHVLASRFHDHLVQAPIGFDEASGNFQLTNSSGAGFGNDPVLAEVNDGYQKSPTPTFNNANFSTPPDGFAPRMQMYLFNNAYDVNGGDVADIVYHEYGHGLSNRLVVNVSGGSTLSSMQPRQMGEAWSDFYALDLLVHEGILRDDPAVPGDLTMGSYVRTSGGIRAKPIDCPVAPAGIPGCDASFGAAVLGGYTYGDLRWTDNTSPHSGGELWAQTLWQIRTAVGRDAALALVTGGMRLSADNPSMLDMRDAILQQAVAMRSAAGASDDHYATLWSIFQQRGMGGDATTPSADSTTPTEGTGAPSGLRAFVPPVITDPYPGGDNDGAIEPGERFEVSQQVMGFGLVDLAGVTGTFRPAVPGAFTIENGSASWPLLGRGRIAANTAPFVGRLPIGSCTATIPVSVDVSSSEGAVQTQAVIDPRLASAAVTPLADATAGGPGVTTASFPVAGSGAVTDVDLRIDELRHTYLGDLVIDLIHDGVTANIVNRLASLDGGFDGDDIVGAVFDSDAVGAPPTSGPGPISGRMHPQTTGALDAFNGHPVAGTWTLRITDAEQNDSGTLRRWGIDSAPAACGRLEIPAAQTAGATATAHDAATLNGAVTPNGRATGVRFAWGTTTGYGAATPVQAVGAGDGSVPATAALAGLTPSTTYHYRAEAIREGGQVAVAGEDRTFTTPAAPLDPPPGPGVIPSPTPPGPGVVPVVPPRDPAPVLSRGRATLARISRRSPRRRATLAFSLSEPATVTAVVTRAATGVRLRRGGRCVAVPRRRPRGARPCTRQLPAARVTVRLTRAGAGSLRLPASGLPRGSYTATLSAVDPTGNRSGRALTIRFRVR